MRFTAFLGTKDEADILPDAIEHLRRIGVDLIIVFDRGSTDGTAAYLSQAEKRGDIWSFWLPNDGREELLGRVRAALARSTETDWVLFMDSDEFWLPREGSLRGLSSLREADVLTVMRYNVVTTPDGPWFPRPIDPGRYHDALLIAQPIAAPPGQVLDDEDVPWVMTLQEPKVMVRPEALASTFSGEHDLTLTSDRRWHWAYATDVLVAHLPVRSFERFEMRARNYQLMVAEQPGWFSGGQGRQWAHFARFADQEQLRQAWQRQIVEDPELARLRSLGAVRSVAEVLARPVPGFTSEARYRAAVGRAQPWINAAGSAARREGITTLGMPAYLPSGDRPTVLISPDRVVQLYARWDDGFRVLDQESAAHQILDRDASLPVSRALAHGRLDDAWRYLILDRPSGVSLHEVRQDLRDSAITDTARWLGRALRGLHAVPLTTEEQEVGLARFRHEMTWRHANAAQMITDRRALPRHLAEQVEAWLPPLEAFIPASGDLVLTHGDLTDRHILGPAYEGGFEPSGIVDFSKSLVGHPMYDLGPIWWRVLRADRGLLAAFLEEASLPLPTGEERVKQALAWVLVHVCENPVRLSAIGDIETLDELAAWSFGAPELEQVRLVP